MTDREILQREIASILDHPSVFMGGPSQQNMRRADRIIRHLADSKRLLSALEEAHSAMTERRAEREAEMAYDQQLADALRENERLRAVVTRAKDALLDGQSTQWVHDLLAAALVHEQSAPIKECPECKTPARQIWMQEHANGCGRGRYKPLPYD